MAKEPDNEILKRSDTHGIATLTLNRPEARNALSTALMDRLQTELDRIRDDKNVHVVVIAANGPSFLLRPRSSRTARNANSENI